MTAIVLNWNGAAYTLRAVASLRASAYPALRILVVDNGSASADVDAIVRGAPDLALLELGANHGFARAVNLGVAEALRAGAEHVLLFNNDAHLPDGVPVIERLVEELTASPRIALAGPIVVDDDGRLRVQAAGIALRAYFPAPPASEKA